MSDIVLGGAPHFLVETNVDIATPAAYPTTVPTIGIGIKEPKNAQDASIPISNPISTAVSVRVSPIVSPVKVQPRPFSS